MSTRITRSFEIGASVAALALLGGATVAAGSAKSSGRRLPDALAYSGGSGAATHVFVARPNGTTRRLARGIVLSWSPDGSRLLVSSGNTSSGDPEIAVDVVRADGSSDVRVIPELHWPGVAKWSPDSRRIAYDDTGGLYVVNADGSGAPRRLSRRVGHAWSAATVAPAWSWSPDSSHIVYVGKSANGRSGVFVVNTDGAPRPARIDVRPRPVVPRGRRVHHRPGFDGATLSPDGSRIAFQWDDGTHICCENDWLYVMRSDGSHATRLRKGCLESWSPDGSEVGLTDGEDDCGAELWVVKVDRTSQRQVGTGASAVTWFPDGSQLAYLTAYRHRLVVVQVDGSGPRLVARSGASTAWGNPPWFSISPDGSAIAYVGGKGLHAGGDLYVVNADGSHRRLIAPAPAGALSGPAWRPVRTP